MEVELTSETSVDNYFTRRRENLKSHKLCILLLNLLKPNGRYMYQPL
jgi:hypothetical protein